MGMALMNFESTWEVIKRKNPNLNLPEIRLSIIDRDFSGIY
jgi:hypothetical protein